MPLTDVAERTIEVESCTVTGIVEASYILWQTWCIRVTFIAQTGN